MPLFSSRSHRAALAGLLLLGGSAAAQTPPTAVPSAAPAPVAPAPPSAAPAVDPQVTTLFNQAVAAHQALSALTATITLSSTDVQPNIAQTLTLAYQKPNQAKVTVAGSAGPIAQFFSDGKTLTLYVVQGKKYRIQPVPPGAETIPLLLDQTHALLPRLLGHPEALSELLAQPGVTASVSNSLVLPVVNGVSVDTVVAALPAPDGSKATFTFDIGKADHLLRRLTQKATVVSAGKPQAFTVTETVTSLSTTPTLTAADFTFTPPPGATQIADAAPTPGSTSGAGTAPQEPLMHDPRLVPGAEPFPVAAKDLRGKTLTLTQYKGHVLLLDFWATWCGPCVGEMPNVLAAFKKYHAQGFDVVGISLDQSRPALAAFIAHNKMPWRQVFDGKGWGSAVPREYGVQAIPFGLLLGRDGKIAAVDVRGPALNAAIKAALAEH